MTTSTSTLFACPVADATGRPCLVFPYDRQDDIDEHVAGGDHLYELTRGRFTRRDDEAANAAAPSLDPRPARTGEAPVQRRAATVTTRTGTFTATPTAESVDDLVRSLGRKFEVSDMTGGLVEFATVWARAYEGTFGFMLDMKAAAAKPRGLSDGMAKGVLNCYRNTVGPDPRATPAPSAPETPASAPQTPARTGSRAEVTEPGMYRHGGDIYRVQLGRDSGQLYAGRMVELAVPIVMRNGETKTHDFEYAGGMIRRLDARDRLTLDEARAFGRETGSCCCCGRTLRKRESIEAGIGPVCAGKV